MQRSINADTNWTNQNRTAYEAALKERDKMWENYRKVNQGSFIVDSAAKSWISNTAEGKLIEEYERRMSNIKKYSEEIAKNNKTVEGIVKQIDTSAYTTDFSGSSQKAERRENRLRLPACRCPRKSTADYGKTPHTDYAGRYCQAYGNGQAGIR